jgi:hypothetical protein
MSIRRSTVETFKLNNQIIILYFTNFNGEGEWNITVNEKPRSHCPGVKN